MSARDNAGHNALAPKPKGIARQWQSTAAGAGLHPIPDLPGLAEDEAGELAWQDEAHCAQVDPELFYPIKGGSTREARAICAQCPVTGPNGPCLEFALTHEAGRFGIWAGTTEQERRRLKRNHGTAAA